MDGEELRGGDVIGDGDASCAEVMEKGTLSPLTGSYLLIVLAEPHSEEDREIILQRLNKGLLSWDVESSHVDLNCELLNLTNSNPEGDEARNGEKLVQWASENLVVEVLIHSQVNTLQQCMKNLLASFTRHRHIIHAGYTFQGSGSWILQDGTFSLSDYLELWSESEVQRILGAYKGDISVTMHCASEDGWTTERLSKEPFAKLCQIQMNPGDKMSNVHNSGIGSFVEFISKMLTPSPLKEILEPSDIVGNIRFSRPTLYVFPGGQGDAALFGINGFNMLIDGGFARRACFWEFTRHLDRLDAVLLTRVNNNTVGGLSSVIQRKVMSQVYPQIGHFFGNLIDRKSSASAALSAEDKKEDPSSSSSEKLLVSLTDHGHRMVENLRNINLKPHLCFRESTIEPINLYHKVGHGKLDLYVLNPAKDSREVKEFLSKWNTDCKSFVSARMSSRQHGETKDFQFPILNLVSICALLVWQPANPRDPITRILFPGSTPQHKIFEALGKLKHLEFLKYPVCSAKTLAASHKSKVKSEKIISEAKEQLLSKVEEQQHQQQLHHQKDSSVPRSISKTSSSSTVIHHRSSSKASKEDVSSSTNRKETSVARRAMSRSNAALNADSNKTKSESPIQKSSRQIKSTAMSRIDTGLSGKAPKAPRKSATMDGTAPAGATKKSPTSPPPSSKKLETTVGRVKSKSSDSPPQTPPKSAKEANNRRVIEHKTKTSSTATAAAAAAKTEKVPSRAVEVKRKTMSSTTKSSIPATTTTTTSKSSPSKKPTAKKAPVTAAAPKPIRGVKKVAGATAVAASTTAAAAAAAAALASSSAEDLGAEKKIQAETNGSVSTDEIKTEHEDQVREKVEGEEADISTAAAAVEEPLAVAEDEQPSSLQPASLPFESGSELSSLDHISVQEDEGQTVSGDERASSVVSRDQMYESETIHGDAETEHEEEEDEEEEEYLIVEKDESTTDNLDERLGSKTMGSLDEPSVPEEQHDGTEEKIVKDEEPEVSKEPEEVEEEEIEGDISKDKVEPVPQEELHVKDDEEAKVQEETEEPLKVETQEVEEIKQSEAEGVAEEDVKKDEELKPEKDEIVGESAAAEEQSTGEAAEAQSAGEAAEAQSAGQAAEENVTEIKEEKAAAEVAKDDEKSAEEKEPAEAIEETVVATDAKEVAAAAAPEKEVAEVTADEKETAEPSVENVSADTAEEDKESAEPSQKVEQEESTEVIETTEVATTEEAEKETGEPAGEKTAAPSEEITAPGAETETIETAAETEEVVESAAPEKQEVELTEAVPKKQEETTAQVTAEKDVTVSSTEIEEAPAEVTAEKQETASDEILSADTKEAEIIAATEEEKDEGVATKLDNETEDTATEPAAKDATEASEKVAASSAKDEGESLPKEETLTASEAAVQEEPAAGAVHDNETTASEISKEVVEISTKEDAAVSEVTPDKVDSSKEEEAIADEKLTEAAPAPEPSKEEPEAAAEKLDVEVAEAVPALSETTTTSEQDQVAQESTEKQADEKQEPAATTDDISNEAELPAKVAEAAEPTSAATSVEVAQEKSTVQEQIDTIATSAEKADDVPEPEIAPSKHDEISNEPPVTESTQQEPSAQTAGETSEAIKEPEVIQEQITSSDVASGKAAIPSESAQEPAEEAVAAVDKASTVDETQSEPSVPEKDEKADTKEPEKITSTIDEPPAVEEGIQISHKTDNKDEYVSALETEPSAAPSASSLEIEKVSSSSAADEISSVIDSAAESKMSLADELLATSISSEKEKVSAEDKDDAVPVEEESLLMKNVSAGESTSTSAAAQGILESEVVCCTIQEQQQPTSSSSTKDDEADGKISQGESSPRVLQHEQHEEEGDETVSEKFPGNNQMFPQQDKVDHETEALIQSSGEKKQDEEGEEKKEVEIPMGEPSSHELHEQAAVEKVGQEKHEQVPVSSHINEVELSQLEQDQYSAAQTLEKLPSSTPSAAIEPLKEDQSGEQILKEITPAQDQDDEQLKERVGEPAVAPEVVAQAETETGKKASLELQTSSSITPAQKEQTIAHDDASAEGEKLPQEEKVPTQKKLDELSHDDKGISTISSLSQKEETSETAVKKLVAEHEQATDQEKTEYLQEKTHTLVTTAAKADLAEAGPLNVSDTAAVPVKPQVEEPEPESEKLSATQLSAGEDIQAVGKPQEKEPTAVPQEKEPSKESEIFTETLPAAEQKEEIIIETQVKENEQLSSSPSSAVEHVIQEVVQQESIQPQPLAVEHRKKSIVAEAEVSISDDVEAKVPQEENKFTAAAPPEKKESVMPEATEAVTTTTTFEKQESEADAPAPESETPLVPEVTSPAAVSRKASSVVAEDVAQTERKVEAVQEVTDESKQIEKQDETLAESIKEKEAGKASEKEESSGSAEIIKEVAAETVATIAAAAEELARKKSLEAVSTTKDDEKPEGEKTESTATDSEIKSEIAPSQEINNVQAQKEPAAAAEVVSSDEKVIVRTAEEDTTEKVEKLESAVTSAKDDVIASKEELPSATTTVESTVASSTEKAGASTDSQETVELKPETDSSIVSAAKAEASAPPESSKPDEVTETDAIELASASDKVTRDRKISVTESTIESTTGKETQEPAVSTATSEKQELSKESGMEQMKLVEDSASGVLSKPTEGSKATSETVTVTEVASAGQQAEREMSVVVDSSTESSAKRSSLVVEEPSSEEMESAKDMAVPTDKPIDTTIITDEPSALPLAEQRKSSVTSAALTEEAIPSSEEESKFESIKPLEIAPEIEVPTATTTTTTTDDSLLAAESTPVVEPSKGAASEPLDVEEQKEPEIQSSNISTVESSIPDKQTESHDKDIIDSVLITTETVTTTESAAAAPASVVASDAEKQPADQKEDVPEKSQTTTTTAVKDEETDKEGEKQESLRRDSASTVVSEVITSSTATAAATTTTTEASSSKSSDLLISGLSSDITQITQEKSAVKETGLSSHEMATTQTGSDVTATTTYSLTSEQQQKSSTDDIITVVTREEIVALTSTTELQTPDRPTSPSIHVVADQIAEKLESLQKATELFEKIENISSAVTTSGQSETTKLVVDDAEKTDEIRSEETVTKTTSKDYIEMSETTEQIVTSSLGQQLLESSTPDATTKPPESSLVNEEILQSKQEEIIAKSGVDHADADDDELKTTSKEPSSSVLSGSVEKVVVECEIESIGATVESAPQEEGSTTAGIPPSTSSVTSSVVAQTSTVVKEEIASSTVSALESVVKSGQEMEVSESATGGAVGEGRNVKTSAIDTILPDTNLASKSLEIFQQHQQQQPEESLNEKYEDESVEKEKVPVLAPALVQESNELTGEKAAAAVTADALHIQIPAGSGDGEKITSETLKELKASGDDVGGAVVREMVREAEDDHDSKFIRPLPYEETPLSQVDKLLRESRELIDKERKEGKGIVGIPSAIPSKLPRESREVIRTPDEVADLPVHEEVEPGTYETDELIDEPDIEEQSEEDQGVEAMGIVNLPPAPPSPVPPSQSATTTKPAEEINVTQQLIDTTTSTPPKPETLNEFSIAAVATTVTATATAAAVPTKIDAAVSPVLESLFGGQSSKTFPEAGPSATTTEISTEQAQQTGSQISSEKEKNVPQPEVGTSEEQKKTETGSSQPPEDIIEVEPEIQADISVKPIVSSKGGEDKVTECKEVVGSTGLFLSQKGLTDVLTKTVTTSVVITPSTPPVSHEAGDDNGNQFSYEQEKGEKESSEEKAEKGKDSMADAGSHIIHEEKKGEESVAAPCTTTGVSGEEEKSKVACLSTGERERTLSTNSDESSTSSATPLTAVSNKESTEAGANRPEETTVKGVAVEQKVEQSSSSVLDKSMDTVQATERDSNETAAEKDEPKEKLFLLPGEEGDDREDNSDRDDHDIYGGTNDEPGMGTVCSGLLTAATTLSAAVISQSPEEFATKSFPGSGAESPQQQHQLQQTPPQQQQQFQQDQSICKDTLERLESAEKTLRESLTTTVESRTVAEAESGVVKESLSSSKEAAADLNVIDQIGSFSCNEKTTSKGFTAVTTTTTTVTSSTTGTDVQEHQRVMETSNECQVTAEKVLTSSESNIAESTVPVSCSETLATKLLSPTIGGSAVVTGEAPAAAVHLEELDTEQIDICIDSSRSGSTGVTTEGKEKQDEEKPVVLPTLSSLATTSSSASIDPAASPALEISTTTHQTFTKESSSSLQTAADSITTTEETLKVGSSSSTSAPITTADLGSGSGEDNAETHSTKDHSHHVTLVQADSRKSSLEDTQEFERAEQVVSSVIEQVEGQVEEKIKVAEQLLEEVEETLLQKSTTFLSSSASSSSTTAAANELEQIRTISSEIITSSSSGSSTTANVGQHDAELASEMFLIADKNVGDVPKTISPAQPAEPLLQQQPDEDEEESCSVVEKAEGESLEKSILPPSTSPPAPVSLETTTSQSTFTSIESNLEEHKSLSPIPSAPVKNDHVDDDSSLVTSSVLDSALTASTFSLTSSATLSMVASTTSKSDDDDVTTSSGVFTEKVILSSASIPTTTCGDSKESSSSSTTKASSDVVESTQSDDKGKEPIKIEMEMKTSDKSALSAEMTTTQHEQDKSTAAIPTSAVSESKEKGEKVVESTTSTTTGGSSHSSASESRSVTTTQLITSKESTGIEKESHEKCSTLSSESSRISTQSSVPGQSESVKEQSSLQQFAEDCGLGKTTGAFSATSTTTITAPDSSQVSQSIRETSSLSSNLPPSSSSSAGGAAASAVPASIELCSAFTTGLPSSSLTSKTTYVTTTTTRYYSAGEAGDDQGSSKGESKVGGDDEGRTSEIIEHSQEISFFGVPSSSSASSSASATTTATAPVDILTSSMSGDTQFVEIAKEREILRTSPGGSYYGGYGLVFGSAATEEAEENPTDEESVYGEDSQSHSLRESNQSIITSSSSSFSTAGKTLLPTSDSGSSTTTTTTSSHVLTGSSSASTTTAATTSSSTSSTSTTTTAGTTTFMDKHGSSFEEMMTMRSGMMGDKFTSFIHTTSAAAAADLMDEGSYSSGDFSDSQLSTMAGGMGGRDLDDVDNLTFDSDLPRPSDVENGNLPSLTSASSSTVITTSTTVSSSIVTAPGSKKEEEKITSTSGGTTATSSSFTTEFSSSSPVSAPSSSSRAKEAKDDEDIVKTWGKPLGLPPVQNEEAAASSNNAAPAPAAAESDSSVPTAAAVSGTATATAATSANATAKGTPKKDKSVDRKNPETPGRAAGHSTSSGGTSRGRSHHRSSRNQSPIYVDLAYVPHHGNSNYCDSEFFRLIRARYYVFSGLEPSRQVFDGLLEGKQSWDDKNLEATIIPTYDTDTLGYWVVDSEDALAEARIDLAPSASRCTINLQDHETSCAAYRLEF